MPALSLKLRRIHNKTCKVILLALLIFSTVFACVTLSPHTLLVVDDSNAGTAAQIRGWNEGSILDELEDKKLYSDIELR